jgi:hypothetical protein
MLEPRARARGRAFPKGFVMARVLGVFSVFLLVFVLGFTVSGCGNSAPTGDKMQDGKMKDSKMKDDKTGGDKMKDDKMHDSKMKDDKMKDDKK